MPRQIDYEFFRILAENIIRWYLSGDVKRQLTGSIIILCYSAPDKCDEAKQRGRVLLKRLEEAELYLSLSKELYLRGEIDRVEIPEPIIEVNEAVIDLLSIAMKHLRHKASRRRDEESKTEEENGKEEEERLDEW